MKSYEMSPAKPHETHLQQVRLERKSENQRLEGLKKTLQTKLEAAGTNQRDHRAA